MAASKTRTSLWNNVTLAAGTPNTTSAVDLSTSYGSTLSIRVTNGSTGPTLPAQIQIQVANDSGGTLYVTLGGANLVAQTGNSVVTTWTIPLDIGWASVKLTGSGNTAQSVILDADISVVTGL